MHAFWLNRDYAPAPKSELYSMHRWYTLLHSLRHTDRRTDIIQLFSLECFQQNSNRNSSFEYSCLFRRILFRAQCANTRRFAGVGEATGSKQDNYTQKRNLRELTSSARSAIVAGTIANVERGTPEKIKTQLILYGAPTTKHIYTSTRTPIDDNDDFKWEIISYWRICDRKEDKLWKVNTTNHYFHHN